MTVIAACRLPEGAIILADSRATWFPGSTIEDQLQKILPLGQSAGLAYAGDVRSAAAVADGLHKWYLRGGRNANLNYLILHAPRIANHCGRGNVELILFGLLADGSVGVWHCSSTSSFSVAEVDRFVVLGSGASARSYFDNNYDQLAGSKATLKEKADRVLLGFAHSLATLSDRHVGGLLQIVILDNRGVMPLRYGFAEANPDQPPVAKEMEAVRGSWVQRDLTGAREVTLVKPQLLASRSASALSFHEYKVNKTNDPNLHLVSLIPCSHVAVKPFGTMINTMSRTWAIQHYPSPWRQMFLVQLWGTHQRGQLVAYLLFNGGATVIGKYDYFLTLPPVVESFVVILRAEIPQPGLYFIELRIDQKVLARFPLAFGQLPHDPLNRTDLVDAEMRRVEKSLTSSRDSGLPARPSAGIELFCVAHKVEFSGRQLRMEGAITSAYWEQYPLDLSVTVCLQCRLPAGARYMLEFEARSVLTGKSVTFMRGEVTSESDTMPIRLVRETVIRLEEPSLYFISALSNGIRLVSTVLAGEKHEARWSFSLMPADELEVKNGQLLLLGQNRVLPPQELRPSDR